METSSVFHALATLFPGKKAITHWTGEWVGTGTGLDNMEEEEKKLLALPGFKPQIIYTVAQSLYQLHYPSSHQVWLEIYTTVVTLHSVYLKMEICLLQGVVM